MNDEKPIEIILSGAENAKAARAAQEAEPQPQPQESPRQQTAPQPRPQPETEQPRQQGGQPEAQPQQTFREALREQIHEEDTADQRTSVMSLLCGDFFTSQIIRRQIWLLLLITFFVIVYISNRYSCQKSLLEIDKLRMELQDAKYKALSTSSRLTEQSRQSRVLDMLKANRDSVLHIADQPPYIVKVPEAE